MICGCARPNCFWKSPTSETCPRNESSVKTSWTCKEVSPNHQFARCASYFESSGSASGSCLRFQSTGFTTSSAAPWHVMASLTVGVLFKFAVPRLQLQAREPICSWRCLRHALRTPTPALSRHARRASEDVKLFLLLVAVRIHLSCWIGRRARRRA